MFAFWLASLWLPATVLTSLVSAEPSLGLVELDAPAYTALRSSTELSYVLFTAPGCAECEEVYALLEKVQNGEISNTTIGKVDCTKEAEICDDARVFSVPTLMLSVGRGELISYRDGWKQNAYVPSFGTSPIYLLKPAHQLAAIHATTDWSCLDRAHRFDVRGLCLFQHNQRCCYRYYQWRRFWGSFQGDRREVVQTLQLWCGTAW